MYKSPSKLLGTIILTGAVMFTSIVLAQSIMNPQGQGGKQGHDDKKGQDDKHNKQDNDQLACYQWDIFPDERFNLNVKTHSSLSKGTKKQDSGTSGKDSGHAQQKAYSVHGKHVVHDFMATVEGTVITAGETSGTTGTTGGTADSTGAHLGLLAKWVRGDGKSADFVRSVTVDCTTDEASATPHTWTCESRNEFDVYHGFSRLTKVDETRDHACNTFEDGKHRGTAALTADSIKGAQASIIDQAHHQNPNPKQNPNQNPKPKK
ncbi:hypothetical protein [Nitrosomonas communis]|uniref:Uncharacterized protein n=1 Tax=Nitrosomonas communis TaxID=44574 RepID=A0A1I4W247_9PROT|nr:hypothetical protein [Nitrosomonas communis]SFN07552.1 hypothetical protein SAMN05421863_109610 [Nitrosomonas communis]